MNDIKPLAILRFKHNPMSKYLYIIHNTTTNKCWLYEVKDDKEAQVLSDRLEITHSECKVVSMYKNLI